MTTRMTRRGFVALAGGLLLGGALAGTAVAQQQEWAPGTGPMGAGGGPRSGGRPGAGAAGLAGAPHAAIAAALGISSEELFAAQRSGKTIIQLAQEKGIDPEMVVTAARAAQKAALDARVQGGQLTQEQADQMQARMEAGIRAHMAGQAGAGRMGTPGAGMRGAGFGQGTGPGMGSGMGTGGGPGRHGPGMMPGFGPQR